MSEPPPFRVYDGPDGRGTYGLLSGCITTLFACVWTAVHLDVPTPVFKGRMLKFSRKTKWLLLGMLAPELLLFTAFLQYWSAQGMEREAIKYEFAERKPQMLVRVWHLLQSAWIWVKKHTCMQGQIYSNVDDGETKKHSLAWTSTHSFYACMGGFAFDLGSSANSFLPESQTRVPLTAAGVKFLMQYAHELIPNISKDEISDKSKADGLAKIVGLHFSVLELNTFAHAVCVLVSYYLWWAKPFDVGEPTLISAETGSDAPETHLNMDARQACPFMYVLSQGLINEPESESGNDYTGLFHFQCSTLDIVSTSSSEISAPSSTGSRNAAAKDSRAEMMRLARQWLQQHSTFEWKAEGSVLPVTRDFSGDYDFSLVVGQNKMAMKDLLGLRWDDIKTLWIDPYILLRSICFCTIAAAYGFVHALAWNLTFPTVIERYIWRCSAVFVATLAFFVPMAQLFFQTQFWKKREDRMLWKFLFWVCLIPSISMLYSMSRVYLVIESVRQVFYLPPDAFSTPSFTKYIPHFE